MNGANDKKPMFTDVQRQLIASSLEVAIEADLWIYCWFQDNERARLGHELTPATKVRDVVHRTRANDLQGFGHFELTMIREAVLAALTAGLELGAKRDDILATVRQIQRRRTERAHQHHELEGSDTVRTEHFRFNVELAARAFAEFAGLNPTELNGHFAARVEAIPERRASVRRHLAVVHELERRSEEWIRRDRETWDPVGPWHLYWEVQDSVCEVTSLVQGPDYNELPSQQRDWVMAKVLRIAPLIDWDVHFALAENLGIVTPPQTVSTT